MATISDWTPEQLQSFILKVIGQDDKKDETAAEKDLTLEECCERWDLESPAAVRCYVATLGMELRRDLFGRDTWPFEYLHLGDRLDQYLKNGGNVRDFPGSLWGKAGLTEAECCNRWDLSTFTSIKDRANAIGLVLDESAHTVWPSEYIALGDNLDRHLKNGGTLIGFRALQAPAQPSAPINSKRRFQMTIEVDQKAADQLALTPGVKIISYND